MTEEVLQKVVPAYLVDGLLVTVLQALLDHERAKRNRLVEQVD